MKRREKKIGVGGSIITSYAKRLVQRVLDSNRLSYGPFLRRFEEKFAALAERKFAISANSGTSALQVAVHALKEIDGWREGDEVIVPAVTFIATSNVVIQNGLKPVFVDVDPKTANIDPSKIEAKITKRTRAIMPVHLFGLSAEMREVMRIAKKHRLRVIEDSCETVGVSYRGKPVGSMGDIACFSTYMAHLVTTGVGGFAATNDPVLAVKIRSLVNHGRDSIYLSMDDDEGLRGQARFEMAQRRFSFVSVGYSYRLTELEGALGIAQLREFSGNLKARSRNARYLLDHLKPFDRFLQLPTWPSYSGHAFMMFPIVVKNPKISREKLIRWLEDWNVETRDLLPLINQPVYRKRFGNLDAEYPVAANLNRNGFYVGCHPEMTRADLGYIVRVFTAFFEGNGFTKETLSGRGK